MTENRTPTEQELDILLDQQPQFDLEAVKQRTLSRTGTVPGHPSRKHAPLRGILIAAVLCALSISAVTAADYATEGRLTMALGIRSQAQETVAEPTRETGAPPVEEKPAAPTAPPEEPQPEPPELDEQIAGTLQIDQVQAQRLRPAVQAVEQTAEDQDIRMTVLQTLGDPSCLYIKMRFDFSADSPMSGDLKFENLRISLEGVDGYSYPCSILERTETSVTYLMQVTHIGSEDLNGRTATVTFENYGLPHTYVEDEVLHLAGEAGKPYTTILRPDGTMLWDATAEDVAALPAETERLAEPPAGFTASRRADGSTVVTYDGAHGDQIVDAYWVPRFDATITGKWEQSWTLSYQDTSQYWTGRQTLFDPRLTATKLRISPLSWQMDFIAEDITPEESFALLPLSGLSSQLRHRDGSLTNLTMDYSSGEVKRKPDSDTTLLIAAGGPFEPSIDLSDVTAVVINGIDFPLS